RTAGGEESDFTGEEKRDFVIDDTNPTGGTTNPSLAVHRYGQLATLAATGGDTTPGSVASVKFRILRMKDGPVKEWDLDSSTFTAAASADDLVATNQGGGVYTYTHAQLSSEAPWEDGLLYKVRLTVTDRAGNSVALEEPGGAGFRFDVSLPTAAVTVPKVGIVVNSLPVISGTAADRDPDGTASSDYEASLVTVVDVFIQSMQSGAYFDGTGFVSGSPVPLSATVTGAGLTKSWTYTAANLNSSLSDGRYVVYARARDAGGNEQQSYSAAGSSFTFLVDKTPPSYTPAAINAANVTGSASDALVSGTSAGLLTDGVDVQLWYLSGGASFYWNNGATDWQTDVTTITADGTSWSLLAKQPSSAKWAQPGDRTFYLRARAHDKTVLGDGNVSPSTGNLSLWTPETAGSTLSFIVDGTPPVSSLTWPLNGLFINGISSITGTAADIGAISPIADVEVKITTNNATGPWWDGNTYVFTETWRPATVTAPNWEYPGATGDKLTVAQGAAQNAFTDHKLYTIFIRARDQATNQEAARSFSVTFDTSAPNLAFGFPYAAPDPQSYSNDTLSDRKFERSSGTVTETGPNASGIVEAWVAVASGSAKDMWWSSTTLSFSQNQATVFWSSNVYLSGAACPGEGTVDSGEWCYAPGSWATEPGAFKEG
ncbi:MAG: hypothetical protein FD126_3464, partial [Elusimicrobia bacterium]